MSDNSLLDHVSDFIVAVHSLYNVFSVRQVAEYPTHQHEWNVTKYVYSALRNNFDLFVL